ncbi:LacI family DNA-binding transcriptional regulator [Streptomyces sp. NPDC059649]|uniref:LacI family DNA-binding transcriptional regulator n=1 Tax=Streptomyces sp. NPDC059649 TaxID=3346895 RepID=UPI0036A81FF6
MASAPQRRSNSVRTTNMSEVARRAGVSVTTVSHVINETRFVSPEKREAVLTAIKETGYVPSTVARSLSTSRTLTLGLAMSAISNPYFGEVAQGIREEAERHGYTLLLADTHDDPERELRIAADLYQRRVDGILLAPAAHGERTLAYLEERGVPVALVDRLISPAHDQVGCENAEATAGLVQHLADLGHSRIGLVSGLAGLSTTDERVAGYRSALAGNGLPVDERLIISGGSDAEPARRAVHALLDLDDPPTALIIGNNHMTIGAMRALRERGKTVPTDIALIAFDDFEWADLFTPRLTTVAQPCHDMGTEAVRLLLSRLKDPDLPPRTVRMPPELMHRDSCGCPAPSSAED